MGHGSEIAFQIYYTPDVQAQAEILDALRPFLPLPPVFSDQVDSLDDDGNGVPDVIDEIEFSLARSYATYTAMNYRAVELPIPVAVHETAGAVLPGFGGPIIVQVDYDSQFSYLPRHELFHRFQYEYVTDEDLVIDYLLDLVSDINWWMEATAEWAAHQVAISPGPAVSEPNLYLEERYDDLDVIRQTWERMDGLGGNPVQAIGDELGERGSSWADEVPGFWSANYLLDSPNGADPYTDPAADIVWRGDLDLITALQGEDDPRAVELNLDEARPLRDPRRLTQAQAASDAVTVDRGGAAYIDLVPLEPGPETLQVEIAADLGVSVLVQLQGFTNYPVPCGPAVPITLSPTGGLQTGGVAFPIDSTCQFATLQIFNTDPTGGAALVGWNAQLCTDPAIVYGSNLTTDSSFEQYLALTGRSVGDELAFLAADGGSGLEWPSDTTTRIPAPYLAPWIQNSGYIPPQNPDVFVGIEDSNPRTGTYHLQIRDDLFQGFLIAEHRVCDLIENTDLWQFWNSFYTTPIASGDTAELTLWASYSGESEGDDLPTHTVNFYFYDSAQTEVGWTGHEEVPFTGPGYDTYTFEATAPAGSAYLIVEYWKEPEFSDTPPFLAVDIDDVTLTIQP